MLYSGGIHSGLNLDIIFRQNLWPSLQGENYPPIYVQGLTNAVLWDILEYISRIYSPSCWSTVMGPFINLMVSKPFQDTKNINVLSGGSLHRVPCPILAAAGGLFCATRALGQLKAAASSVPCPLLLWFRCPAWTIGSRFPCRNTSSLLRWAVLQ